MYSYIYENYDENTIMFMTIPVLVLSTILLNFFTILDICEFNYFYIYRIKYDNIRKYPTKKEISISIIQFYKNFFGLIIPVATLGIYITNKLDIYLYDLKPNIDIFYCFTNLCAVLFLSDMLFYILHRIMHIQYFYKKYHKFHHRFKQPHALTNYYVDYTEILLFFLPAIIPTILLHSHITVVWLNIIILNTNGILIHCGYNFNIFSISYNNNNIISFPCIKEHDYHHKYFNYNYAALFPFIDKLFGTYYIES